MEIVIPPRNHGASEEMSQWNENGDVPQVRRMQSGEWMGSSPRKATHDRMKSEAGSSTMMRNFHRERAKGRQTVNWPFQSIASGTTIISTPVEPEDSPLRKRRQTWQTPVARDSVFSIDGSIVPDYVRNYLRGETPETLAMKRKNIGLLAERDVNLIQGDHDQRGLHSRSGELNDDGAASTIGSEMSADDRRRLMRGYGRRENGSWGSLAGGWRAGVAINVLIAFVVLVGSLACFVVAIVGSRPAQRLLTDPSAIFSGSCTEANQISYGLHALFNVLGIVGIAGANYVFQVLTSPTRAEVDAAHAQRRWLDIGIPSMRNLGRVSSARGVMSIVLLVVAVTSQVIYNSLIFTSQTGAGYNLVFVTESFLTGAPFSNATSNNAGGLGRLEILALQDQANRNQLVNMTTGDCLSRFSGDFGAEFGAALIVTQLNDESNSLVQTATPASSARFGINPVAGKSENAVRYCLAQRATNNPQTCSVALNGSLLGVTVILNLVTLVIAALVLFRTSRATRPLVTLGDAISSFLQVADETTKGSCLMTKTDVLQNRWGLREIKYWIPKAQFWFQSASLARWIFVGSVWVAMTGLTAAALGINLSFGEHDSATDRPLTALGIASATATFPIGSATPAAAVSLIAALPQLLLAIFYLATNGLLTAFYLSYESSVYACGTPRPLRVSYDPQGDQTTSLFLTLPRPISWGLAVVFAGTGFLLSQSLFVVGVRLNDDGGASSELVALGFSGAGLLALLSVLVVLAACVVGLSLRRVPDAATLDGRPSGNPLVLEAGSCSAVLSSRCHNSEPEEPSDMVTRNLMWGSVSPTWRDGMAVSHCAFSSRGVEKLDLMSGYA